jgi:inorganic phosphate transporter, PiT family
MGLIMLILIGTVPTAYALNRAMPRTRSRKFAGLIAGASAVIEQQGGRLQRASAIRARR